MSTFCPIFIYQIMNNEIITDIQCFCFCKIVILKSDKFERIYTINVLTINNFNYRLI